MLPGHALGATGAGDVKFMAAVGAIVGPALVVSAFLFTAVAGGVLALGGGSQAKRLAATLAGTGPPDCRAGRGEEGNPGGDGVEPLRIRTGHCDRQRPCGADWMSARRSSALSDRQADHDETTSGTNAAPH